MAKDKACDWWKMKEAWGEILLSFPDEAVGKALKDAYSYLLYGEAIEITDQEPSENQIVHRIAFNLFKSSVDGAIQKYRDAQENGRKRQEIARQNRQKREEEAKRYGEAEHSREKEESRDQILDENNIDLHDTEHLSLEELERAVQKLERNH